MLNNPWAEFLESTPFSHYVPFISLVIGSAVFLSPRPYAVSSFMRASKDLHRVSYTARGIKKDTSGWPSNWYSELGEPSFLTASWMKQEIYLLRLLSLIFHHASFCTCHHTSKTLMPQLVLLTVFLGILADTAFSKSSSQVTCFGK